MAMAVPGLRVAPFTEAIVIPLRKARRNLTKPRRERRGSVCMLGEGRFRGAGWEAIQSHLGRTCPWV